MISKLNRNLRILQAIHLAAHLLKSAAIWCLLAVTVRAQLGWGPVHLISVVSFLIFLARDFPLRKTAMARLEILRPDSNFRFTTVFELTQKSGHPDSPTWRMLLQETTDRLSRPTQFLSFPGFAFAFRFFAGTVCFALIGALLFPPADRGSLSMPLMLRVKVPERPVLAGADARVRVLAEGRMAMHRLRVKLASAREEEAPSEILLESSTDGIYESFIRGVSADLKLTAAALAPGGVQIVSPEVLLRVVRPPTLGFVSAVVTPPAYTGLPPEKIKSLGNGFALYPGSDLDIRLESDLPIASASASVGARSAARSLKTNLRDREIQVSATFLAPARLEIRAISADSLPAAPAGFDVDTLADRAPTVTWLSPTRTEMEAPAEGLLPLRWLTEDDFGISAARVLIGTPEGSLNKEIPIPFLPKARQEIAYLLDITPHLSYAGSEIDVRAEVLDNDALAGPKAGRSAALRIRAPTAMDVYRRLTEQGADISRMMERLSGESKRLLKKMTSAARTMKAEGRMAWQMEQELVAMAEETERAKKDAERALAELGKRAESAAGQKLLSRETLDKLSAIGQMMTRLMKDDYVRAQRELERALGSVRIEEKERSMMSAKFNLEQFVDQVDRSHRMLERVSDIMAQSEAMKAVQDLAARADQAMSSKNAQQMEALGKEAAALMPKLEDLARNPAFAELKKALSQGASDLARQFDKTAQTMKGGGTPQEKEAAEQKLKDSLAAIQSALEKGAEKSEKAEKENAAEKLNSLVDGIVFSLGRMQASHEYFQSARAQRDPAEYSRHLRKSAAFEPVLAHSIAEVSAVAERLILFDPRPVQMLRRAVLALKAIPDRDEEPAFLAAQLGIAYRFAAHAGLLLLDSAQKLQKESKGKGRGQPMQDLAELLQQMISAQSSLNSKTQMSMQMNLFGDNLEQLAFQQELIRRSMEAEAGRFSDLQEKLGRIDQVMQEMRKIEEDLRRMGPNQAVQERQQKVLNKLMELQQSLTDKDEKEERFEAEPFFGKAADTSTLRLDRPPVNEEQYLRSLPPEYREAGKKYLRSLFGETLQ